MAVAGVMSAWMFGALADRQESETEMNQVEVLADEEWMEELKCHSGGEGSSSCSIDGSFHLTIGGFGGSCSVECREGYYACCGMSCKCVKESY